MVVAFQEILQCGRTNPSGNAGRTTPESVELKKIWVLIFNSDSDDWVKF